MKYRSAKCSDITTFNGLWLRTQIANIVGLRNAHRGWMFRNELHSSLEKKFNQWNRQRRTSALANGPIQASTVDYLIQPSCSIFKGVTKRGRIEML